MHFEEQYCVVLLKLDFPTKKVLATFLPFGRILHKDILEHSLSPYMLSDGVTAVFHNKEQHFHCQRLGLV